ncbi:hypothetical protein ACC699_40735, partial [Rhizobium ruizarguesonis]
ILTYSPEFKRDLAKKYEMIVFPETKGTFFVDLKGTYKAMALDVFVNLYNLGGLDAINVSLRSLSDDERLGALLSL